MSIPNVLLICCAILGHPNRGLRRFISTTALAPPGPRIFAIVANRCARSTSKTFMTLKGRGNCLKEQDCLSYRFQVIITNSPRIHLIFLPAIRKLTRCMKYPQNLNPLQARSNAIRHYITCIWNDEFVCSGQSTWMAKRRILSQ